MRPLPIGSISGPRGHQDSKGDASAMPWVR